VAVQSCGVVYLEEELGSPSLPSAMTVVSHRRWRYRQVVGVVNRALTRLGFPKHLSFDYVSSYEHSNST
jgi:hypothetical protein